MAHEGINKGNEMQTVLDTKNIYVEGACSGQGENHLFFSERPNELARAQAICDTCSVKIECLSEALERKEEWGVWGGVIFWDGEAFYRKRGRGRPRKEDANTAFEAAREDLWQLVKSA